MASQAGGHVPGYKPAVTNGGWGFALFICVLTVALWIGAWMIHRATYEDPRNPLSTGSEQSAKEAHGGGGGH